MSASRGQSKVTEPEHIS